MGTQWQGLIPAGMLAKAFMLHAYQSATIVAIVSALVGYFVVLRGAAFAAHSLPKIGFAGAAGAILLNVSTLFGLTAFCLLGALGIGALSRRGRRDVVTALILTMALGAGALFLSITNAYSHSAYALLFGQIVGVSSAQVTQTALIGMLGIALWIALYRPLLFLTVSKEQAMAQGVPARLLEILFLVLVGLVCAITLPTVGALLSFSLLIGPAATAIQITKRPYQTILLSVVLSVLTMWLALLLAYDSGWPVSFFLTSAIAAEYGLVRIGKALVQYTSVRRQVAPQ